jgi:hypothetical protein
MPVYENMPLVDFVEELSLYTPCWKSIVIVGIAIEENENFFPMGMQIWADVKTTLKNEETIYRAPDLPNDLIFFKIVITANEFPCFIKRIFNRECIKIKNIKLNFLHCSFERSAFLGAYSYENLYPEEHKERVSENPVYFSKAVLIIIRPLKRKY